LSRGLTYVVRETERVQHRHDPAQDRTQGTLEEYAKQQGQDPPAALDDALAAYLEWEGQDFAEAAEGIRLGHEDMSDGKTRPAGEFLADLRRKHDIPRRDDGGGRVGCTRDPGVVVVAARWECRSSVICGVRGLDWISRPVS